MSMVKGDQYAIPIQIKKGSVIVTPQNCTDVRIQIGNILKEYSKGELTFNATNNCWNFSLTEKETKALNSNTQYQVGVKNTNEYVYSTTQQFIVESNIIKEDWA